MKTLIRTATIIVLLLTLAALTEYAMGRRLWGVSGTPGLWSGDIWSEHNSQCVADPYTFTHVNHGVVLYGLLALAASSLPPSTRLIGAVALESGWEIFENSEFIIQRYRTATVSLHYDGDSIVHSMGDIVACLCGFLLASRLPKRVTLIGMIAIEILLAVWIRDNLALNILMLLRPSHTIRLWQLGI
jgi:hypothetical protein